MKTINRGYLLIEPKQPFCDWAHMHDEEFDFDETDQPEGTLYLIEEDFWEIEPVLEKHFKTIMNAECEAITSSEEDWPKPTMSLFLEWFSVKAGVTVADLEKSDLVAE